MPIWSAGFASASTSTNSRARCWPPTAPGGFPFPWRRTRRRNTPGTGSFTCPSSAPTASISAIPPAGPGFSFSARAPGGREAFRSYLEQRRIARTARAKFRQIWELFRTHRGERVLVFTADNDTAYEIGQRFLLPVITHHTKVTERREFLDGFRAGLYPILVTSKVLNEGVDVPEASVGIVVSGSGSIREHVQRLGRILRPAAGKQAVLYELVSEGTGESYTSERRRQHRAYQRPRPLSH